MDTIEFRVVLLDEQRTSNGWKMTFRNTPTFSDAKIAHFKIPVGPDPVESLCAGLSLVDFNELSRLDITLQ